jgi:hypothetical protein
LQDGPLWLAYTLSPRIVRHVNMQMSVRVSRVEAVHSGGMQGKLPLTGDKMVRPAPNATLKGKDVCLPIHIQPCHTSTVLVEGITCICPLFAIV